MTSYALPITYGMLQLLTFFAVGFWSRRVDLFPQEFYVQTSRFVVRIALPVYYFVRVSRTDLSAIRSALLFPLASVIIILAGFLFSLAIVSSFGFRGVQKRAGLALGTFGNSGFMPLFLIEIFPLSLPVIGERFGINVPLLYVGAFALVQSPMIWAVGNYLISGSVRRPRLSELVSPPLYGLLAGLVVALLGGGDLIQDRSLPFFHVYVSLEKLGVIMFPMMIVCLGATVAELNVAGDGTRSRYLVLAVAVSLVRFLALPGLFFLGYFVVLRSLELSPPQLWVLFLELHTPPGTALSIMAVQAGANEEASSIVIIVTYLLYLIVLPLFVIAFLSLPGVLP